MPGSLSQSHQRLARLRKQLDSGCPLLPSEQDWLLTFAGGMHGKVAVCILQIRECLDQDDTLNWPQRFADIGEDLADAIGDGSE